jgi:drug/metabolite transporter (DMT)-like permease
MAASRKKLGLLLGFFGMCLFAGTLPATRLAVSGFDPLFLTVARAALAGSAGLIVLLITRRRLPPRSLWLEMFGAAFCTVVGFPLFAAHARHLPDRSNPAFSLAVVAQRASGGDVGSIHPAIARSAASPPTSCSI